MNYRADIDGLRAVAVLPVVLFHADIFNIFQGGYLGVDVFFVISGYLITSIILSDIAAAKFSFVQFYERRIRRILPAQVLVIICTIPFALLWLPPDMLQEFVRSVSRTMQLRSNLFFMQVTGYFNDSNLLKPLIHMWSLSIEEQFYLLFPLLLVFMSRFARSWLLPVLIVGTILSLGMAEWGIRNYPRVAFYSLPTRAWELAIGAILALLASRYGRLPAKGLLGLLPLAGIILIFGSMVMFDSTTRHPSLLTILPVTGTAMVIWFGGGNDPCTRLLSFKPLVGVGLISYSLYLWHQPVLALGRAYSIDRLDVFMTLALIGLSVGLAVLSWKYVEVPCRTRTKVPSWMVWSFGPAVVVCLLVFTKVEILRDGFPTRFPQTVLDAMAAKPGYYNVAGDDCSARQCVIGDPSAAPSYLIMGDSHASMLARSFDVALRAEGQAAIMSAEGGIFLTRETRLQDVTPLERAAIPSRAKLLEDPNIKTVILAGRYTLKFDGRPFDNGEGGKEYRSVISRSDAQKVELQRLWRDDVEFLLGLGKRVVLIYPVPEVGWHVPVTTFKRFIRGSTEDITTSYERYMQRNHDILELFDGIGEHSRLLRLRPDRLLCGATSPDRCVTRRDGVILYVDDNHLSTAGAELLVTHMMREMSR
ncbi:MAG: acyltransferase [Alphaproteobacteria bacterium]|nr:acyltransferase [Alphaproteobacteria bacterium]